MLWSGLTNCPENNTQIVAGFAWSSWTSVLKTDSRYASRYDAAGTAKKIGL